MAIRISQRQIHSSMVSRMNDNLSAYMKTHLQSSTQKKVNKPSDDPYGASQIMNSHAQLTAIEQYKDNLSMASGWLTTAGGVLGQVNTSLTRLVEIMEQGVTGTYTAEQRDILATEVRTMFGQMLTAANSKFNGRYLFGGHKTDSTAFVETLHINARDPQMDGVQYNVKGSLSKTAIVQFTEDKALDAVPPPTFRYTLDNGKTWTTGSWTAGPPQTMNCGSDIDIELFNITGVNVSAVTDLTSSTETGTWLYVRPSAEYKGDTNNPTVVQSYPYTSPVGASASGVFNRDVSVRIDNVAGGKIFYSYSTDDGTSWTSGDAPDTPPRKLPIAGGFLNLDNSPTVGSQFVVRPHRADIDLTIGPNASITINSIGCDIFGGLYAEPFSEKGAQPVMDDVSRNLFEVMGKAIAFLETNGQTGAQEIFAQVKSCIEQVTKAETTMGARINRVDTIKYQLEQMKLDENSRLADIEDADLSEIMTKLSQQELAYRSVLQSSSMIMQISLLNFL